MQIKCALNQTPRNDRIYNISENFALLISIPIINTLFNVLLNETHDKHFKLFIIFSLKIILWYQSQEYFIQNPLGT